MTTRLRLHRDQPEATPPSKFGGSEPVYKFPAAAVAAVANGGRGGSRVVRRASRERLVAARVREAPVEKCFEGSACGVLIGGHNPDCAGRIVTSGQLVREIESTLDRMQSRLSDFREHVDRAFRFPDLSGGGGGADGDELPPAA